MNSKDVLFPHEKFREIQVSLIKEVKTSLEEGKHLVINAPTGIGKTASTLAPALAYALKHDLTVFFLTSRHTQHKIALETVKKIKERYNLDFGATSIIGKKWLCAVDGVDNLRSSDFAEYCKAVRKDNKCDFYKNTRKNGDWTEQAQKASLNLSKRTPILPETIHAEMKTLELCPYEISMLLSKNARVIITDYYYMFNEKIRDTFFLKTGKSIEKSIIIVDEAHNLGERIKDLATVRLTSFILSRAIKESRKYADVETTSILESIVMMIETRSDNIEEEKEEEIVTKDFLIEGIKKLIDYDDFIGDLQKISDRIREEQRVSFMGVIAKFLEEWKQDKEGFVRILTKDKINDSLMLSYRCLDPSVISSEIINNSKSTIIMSGTLNPTSMYKQLLGFPEETKEISYPDPFPEKNKLSLIIPKTTTKYSERSDDQFKEIAEHCVKIINRIPGNSIIFFPSYFLRNEIHKKMVLFSQKPLILEKQDMNNVEKQNLLEEFKNSSREGACLLAVSSGNFSEGINLHGDHLKGVIIVGLPLQRPDLETDSLIKYYDKKFGKGWDYGYLIPAFNKVLQSAGRCIRSETDRGVIVFLDRRYILSTYFRLFPKDMKIKITLLYDSLIENFFKQKL